MRNVKRRVSGVILSLSVLALSGVVSAQNPSPPEKGAAAIGKEVSVTAQDGTHQKGILLAISAQEVQLRTRTGDRTLGLGTVREIRRGSHAVRNGTVVGALAGVGFSVAELGCNCDYGPEVLLWPGIGAGVGAAAGAVIRMASASSRLVYQRPSNAAVALRPVVAKGRVGVSGAFQW
jgi:hypothetical protein